MLDVYFLMHKNTKCALVALDSTINALVEFHPLNKKLLPFLGNANEKLIATWWNRRAVPASRSEMIHYIRNMGCFDTKEYLANNLALSLTDSYWICPLEEELSWEKVNIYQNFSSCKETLPLHTTLSYDPNASLGGVMDKYWDVQDGIPVLIKKGYMMFGQQSINELFASLIHERQHNHIPYVKYAIRKGIDNAVLSCCPAFTSIDIEFIPAYEIINSKKRKDDTSDFEHYINVCCENGIDRDELHEYMDYLILTDFVISNTDEHYYNFGVIRNANTMELLGPAPIFDSGNSMFLDNKLNEPLCKKELLNQTIHSFHTEQEQMLEYVKNRHAVDINKLPSHNEVFEIYSKNGIPQRRASAIAKSYERKVGLLKDFQCGKTMSL